MNSEIVRMELNLPPPPPIPSLTPPPENNNNEDDGAIVEGILKRPSYRKSVNLDVDNASLTSSAALHINCISTNHYERLVEELKCPGCATPMKAPIKLCCTGHSVCDGCTNLLDSCPLCKEPFTNIRSLTIEAISSKAFFRCHNSTAGCPVRLQTELLGWHEKQCAYKTMKCFMGRVWGECNWVGREVLWKEHLETSHSDKKIDGGYAELCWKLNDPKKSIAGYYVFDVYDEMFNFYQINDKDRLLFTMACTSTTRDKKLNFSYDVEIFCPEDETFVIRHRYPCHSEYDKDILQEGTCVNIPINETARFVTNDRVLHFRVIVNKVNKRPKSLAIDSKNSKVIPLNFQQTQIEGVNLKSVPLVNIVTRKSGLGSPSEESEPSNEEKPNQEERSKSEEPRKPDQDELTELKSITSRSSLDLGDDPELEAFIKARWGTPQLNFNRKFLVNSVENSPSSSSKMSSNESNGVSMRDEEYLAAMEKNYEAVHGKDGKMSVKRMKKGIRKSLKNLKLEFYEMTSHKKSPSNAGTPIEEKPKNIKA